MKEIEVRYGMGQRYSFVNIDGKRLGQALTEIGYNTGSIKPLAVGNEPDSSFLKETKHEEENI